MSDDKRNLVSTGIDGLDNLLGGGFASNRLYLIEGEPGSGKTTLAMQFLLEGRRAGERVLYVTLSETTAELQTVATSHGWTLDGVDTHQLSPIGNATADEYTLYHPAEVELGDLTKTVLAEVDAHKPTRVVFDSLSELRLLARDPLRYRRQILGLKEFFSQRQCTVLLLDDHSTGEEDLQLRSLAHGVVLLDQQPFAYGRSRRRLRIVKMRAAAVIEGFHDFLIRRGGLVVFPQLEPGSDGNLALTAVKSGVGELDELLGGGLTWGTTTLLIGPSGVGKSTVGAQYLCGAANLDAKAAVFLFDERRSMFINRCDALGMRASERAASGHLLVEQVEPGSTSPGEFSHRIKGLIEKGVRLLGIDTLNGYLNAVPTSDAPIIRMHQLLSFLNQRGVATLVMLAQYGIVGTSMQSPIDLSYIADAILLFRFFEADGEVRKAISVMKKRTGRHESSIRELKLGPEQVHVGQPLADFHGILTGVPQYTGQARTLLSDESARKQR